MCVEEVGTYSSYTREQLVRQMVNTATHQKHSLLIDMMLILRLLWYLERAVFCEF